MDGDDMNDITQSTQDIKRLSTSDITHNKAAWIRRIFGIGFNDFTFVNNLFNLGQGDTSIVTASLAMSGNLKFTGIKFFPNFFNHWRKCYHNTNVLSRQSILNPRSNESKPRDFSFVSLSFRRKK